MKRFNFKKLFTRKIYIKWYKDISLKDKSVVGERVAFMSELQKLEKINSPTGFAITSEFLQHFYEKSGVKDEIKNIEDNMNTENCNDLEARALFLRDKILENNFPKELEEKIVEAYSNLSNKGKKILVIRPSGLDFGDYKIFVKNKEELIPKIKEAISFLFTDDHFIYRETFGLNHTDNRISLSIEDTQDLEQGHSGECYTSDIEIGRKLMYINSMYGDNIEDIQKGLKHPSEYWIYKKKIFTHQPIIKKMTRERKENIHIDDVATLSKICYYIEKYFLDLVDNIELKIEWKKPKDSEFYISSVLPIDIKWRTNRACIEQYHLNGSQELVTEGIAVGHQITSGNAFVKKKPKIPPPNSILVANNANYCNGIVLNHGSLTSYPALMARELGIPCIIQTKDATEKIKNGDLITVDCSSGDGKIWKGAALFTVKTKECIFDHPKSKTHIMIELDIPDIAGRYSDLPCKGVGEISLNMILKDCDIDPMKIKDKEQFKEKVSESLGYLCALFDPRTVILKLDEIKNQNLSESFWKLFFETFQIVKERFGLDNVMFKMEDYKYLDQENFILQQFEKYNIGKDKRFFIHKNPKKEINYERIQKNFHGMILNFNDYLDTNPLNNTILIDVIQELQKRCYEFGLIMGVHIETVNEELMTYLFQKEISFLTIPPIDLPFVLQLGSKYSKSHKSD